MYSIIFSPTAKRQLERLERLMQLRIISALERIRIRPDKYVKRLVGYRAYRLRVGDYRMIMDIEKDRIVILILKIAHRKRIYKR